MNNKVLVVTGMHRSGTSLLAQYLHECGLFLGDKLLDGGLVNQGSRGGHHEDMEFINFHNTVLNKRGIPVFLSDYSFQTIQLDRQEYSLAKEVIYNRSKLACQWGWKDPRTVLFLDLWYSLVPDCKFLFVFRHPLKVVDSILRRGKDSIVIKNPVIGLKAWRIYNEEIMKFIDQHQEKSLLIEVDDFIQNYEALIMSLEDRFSISLNKVLIEDVFEEKAFKTNNLNLIDDLSRKYSLEIRKCLEMYEELKTLSFTWNR